MEVARSVNHRGLPGVGGLQKKLKQAVSKQLNMPKFQLVKKVFLLVYCPASLTTGHVTRPILVGT